MKALFAALLCFVLAASQTFAIKGGPEYPAGTNLTGSFAGVLQGVFDPTNPGSSNSIGVFSFGVPKTGNATGPFVMFSRGRVFSGTITGTADPTKATIKGILKASFSFTVSRTVTDVFGQHIEAVPVTAEANGPLDAKVATAKTARTFSTATTILQGSATLNISEGQVNSTNDLIIVDILSLTVSGYKQSDAAPTGTGG